MASADSIRSHSLISRRLLVMLVLAFFAWPSGRILAQAPATNIVLLEIEGANVEVLRAGSNMPDPASTKPPYNILRPGDQLRTGERSRALVRWHDLTLLRVGELSRVQIPPPAEKRTGLNMLRGVLYFFHRDKPGDFELRTPTVSCVVRGTEFTVKVADNETTTLGLIDGEVEMANNAGRLNLRNDESGTAETGKAPVRSAFIEADNIIQWCLYYPGVLDADELALNNQETQALEKSLAAYRTGDLLAALKEYPAGREPTSNGEKIYFAALLLSVGQVEQAQVLLNAMTSSDDPAGRLAAALLKMIAAVKLKFIQSAAPQTATAWMAESYYRQSKSDLNGAMLAARSATEKAPGFGFAWSRLAEMEFSFGRIDKARAAVEKSLGLSPRNAQALALEGFLLAADGKTREAAGYFDQAIAIDGALANAWLGRGLVKMHDGRTQEGLEDLQAAATLEPQRAILRSYLGKAFNHTRDMKRAETEYDRARKMDPNDPTSWLYSALLFQQENRINEAINDLEKSQSLNNNRSVFRSKLLLDEDQAVRSANLASIYRDAGMFEVSVQEASRAVGYDYANYSAHLFLADSYDALRDPQLINLRYETPAFSELLVASLLAPASGGSLSRNISQQEYSRLFDADHFGVYSGTEYLSRGAWIESGSQYGIWGNSSYSFDAFYRTDPGQRPNNDIDQLDLALRFKQQLTPKDSLFAEVEYFNSTSGDVSQYYNQADASQGLRVHEQQAPNVLLGYHHEWSPGSHTLFLAGCFDDTLTLSDSTPKLLFLQTFVNPFTGATNINLLNPALASVAYRSELVAYSAELQHIWQSPRQTLIVGARYQTGTSDTSDQIDQFTSVVTSTNVNTDLNRVSVYAYENFQVFDQLRLTAGVCYDHLHYPVNIDTSPVGSGEASKDQVSPKAGILWTPFKETQLRGAYTKSLGGVFFDQSVRLEPTQIDGFNQAFRSLIPESVVGLVPGTSFQTFGAGWDQSLKKTGTYLTVEGNILKSDGTRTVGMLINGDTSSPPPDTASSTQQSLNYEEKSLIVALNQRVGNGFSFGVRYRLTHADLEERSLDIAPTIPGASALNQDAQATLHQVYLSANYYHRCGFFTQFTAVWSQQSNQGYSPDIPGDDFWQFNIYGGYRFLQRRMEARIGLLNITGQDYQLNPLTLYNEMPRTRTLAASFKFYF